MCGADNLYSLDLVGKFVVNKFRIIRNSSGGVTSDVTIKMNVYLSETNILFAIYRFHSAGAMLFSWEILVLSPAVFLGQRRVTRL